MRTSLLLVLFLASSPALAQSSAPGPTPSPAPGAATSSTPASSLAVPPPPQVNDPMLAPVSRPPRIVSSWPEVLGYLRTRSTDLKIAVDQVLKAEAQTRQALAAYLPSINGTGRYIHNFITNTVSTSIRVPGIQQSSTVPLPDSEDGTIQLQQAIVNVPAFDQISINALGEDAAKWSVEDQKRTLALSVANQLVAVVTAERSAEINRIGLRVALEQLDIATRKQALGAANGLDVVRARQNAANARATLVTGDESLREAREALGLALGVPEETGVAPDLNIDAMANAAMGSCRQVASVDERADIAAARTNL
ncbi:MAG TPA: TolC family protein, partial [Polyangiaceae bacterium]|nr:TolC family protein [Polyangiaceae bacterium]